ncbi:BON domain-containing protein [Streptomyces sp. NPDC001292]|uniref:BON domain-containing protein n=1 Tax=Streptomyces sp. NPDC001292 TaxID=3364558 RepID=UPI00368797E0
MNRHIKTVTFITLLGNRYFSGMQEGSESAEALDDGALTHTQPHHSLLHGPARAQTTRLPSSSTAANTPEDEGAWPLRVQAGRVGGPRGRLLRPDLLHVFLRSDEEIRQEIRQEIRDEVLTAILRLSGQELQVQVHDGVVTLRGDVDERSTAQIAERLAEGVDGAVTVRPLIDYAMDDRTAKG